MRKVLFLMFLLLLMGLGAASVKAQVRIGGNTPPNPAAALDLNAAEGTTTGTKGLALPRIALGSNTATLDGTTTNITGMLVYNTGGSLKPGIYYWNGTNWNRVDDGFLGGDTIVGNEVIGATVGGGLVLSGSGTSTSPRTLGIAQKGVYFSNLNVTDYQLGSTAAPAGQMGYLDLPAGCTIGNSWWSGTYATTGFDVVWDNTGTRLDISSRSGGAVPTMTIWVVCIR